MDTTMDSPLKGSINRLAAAVPLYIQIAEGLIDQIENGDLAPGDRLPSEREMSTALGVNRMTLRQALQMLEARGLLIRRQGDGTYVAEPRIEQRSGQWMPFSGRMDFSYQPRARVLRVERSPASASVARELALPVATLLFHIHRVRLVNGQPVVLERFAVPVQRFPDLDTKDLEQALVYDIMEQVYGVRVKWVRQSLEPVLATSYEAEILEVHEGAPLLLERRHAFDAHDQPLEYGKDVYRGDRIRFVTETDL